jgi:diaminohydroxyphosphoribosylaminopyrimidine deaminase/5-amino-6-(5-phosphoribosylamino)uracil reductase
VSLPDGFQRIDGDTPAEMLANLYAAGVTSVLIEGGAALSQSFLEAGLVDLVRVETAETVTLGSGVAAPSLNGRVADSTLKVGENRLDYYGEKPWFVDL